jgi:hypothetical protein
MFVCLLRSSATVQVTLLLFARLERSRTPTILACVRDWKPLDGTRLYAFFISLGNFVRATLLFEHHLASFLLALYLLSGAIVLMFGGSNTHLACWIFSSGFSLAEASVFRMTI